MKNLKKLLLVILCAPFAAVAMIMVLGYIIEHLPDPTPPTAAEANAGKALEEAIRIGEFEYTVKQNLRDPDSYQRIQAGSPVNGDVCIVYRSKNGFGGYAEGRALYVKQTNTYTVTDLSQATDGFVKEWRQHCQVHPQKQIAASGKKAPK